jgi:enamine deaminase RidA (YjgF/YER057c/UK114 family)
LAGAAALTNVEKRAANGLSITTLRRDSVQEHFITLTPKGDESPESLFQRLGEAVRQLRGEVISVESLGMSAADRRSLDCLNRALGGSDAPVGWVENTRTDNLCGVHLWAISGAKIVPVHSGGRRIGTQWEDKSARYLRLVGLLPIDLALSRPQQADGIFRQMDATLAEHRLTFSNVLRTWFYNDDILAWYRDFNAVRNAFFRERGVFNGMMPASTGVAGRNAIEAGLISGLIAVEAKDPTVKAYAVPSPLQSSAADYGSSFSRAVELDLPDHRRLYVSGTASIDGSGKTVFLGDCRAQVRQTMEVVQAILRSRGMDWTDVTRSLAYFKKAPDACLFEAYRKDSKMPLFPAVVVENDICRDDLLFEIEVDAVKMK